MLYVTYKNSEIQIWNSKPAGSDLYCSRDYTRDEHLIYKVEPEEPSFKAWKDFFFPTSKFGDGSYYRVRPVSQETFDRLIAGEYDKVKKKYMDAQLESRIPEEKQ